MFIVCTLIIAIGVLKYLKSQEEDISTTDNSELVQLPAMTFDSINPGVNNPVVQNNQNSIVNSNVVNTPVVQNNSVKPIVNPNVVSNSVVQNNPVKPVVNPNVVSNPVVQNNAVKPIVNPNVVNNPVIQNNPVKPIVNPNVVNSSLKLDALSQDKEIVIKDGDLLWKICNDEYKNGSYCNKVIEYNKSQYNNIINPKQLKKNSVIYLPPVSYFKTESKKTATQVSIKNNTKNNTHVALNNKPQPKKANDKIYEIQSGDTFSSISRKEYKTCKYAKSILDYNNSVYHLNLNEKKLQIKTKIYLPPQRYFANNDTIHIVKANETLGTISQKHYKTSKYAKALQQYNNIQDISKLQINQEILIPSLSALEKVETEKLPNRENKRKSNSNKSDLEKLSDYQLISVKKSINTWDSLAKCYQISKSKLIECNNGLYKIYPKIIPEASQIKIPIQIAQRKSL